MILIAQVIQDTQAFIHTLQTRDLIVKTGVLRLYLMEVQKTIAQLVQENTNYVAKLTSQTVDLELGTFSEQDTQQATQLIARANTMLTAFNTQLNTILETIPQVQVRATPYPSSLQLASSRQRSRSVSQSVFVAKVFDAEQPHHSGSLLDLFAHPGDLFRRSPTPHTVDDSNQQGGSKLKNLIEQPPSDTLHDALIVPVIQGLESEPKLEPDVTSIPIAVPSVEPHHQAPLASTTTQSDNTIAAQTTKAQRNSRFGSMFRSAKDEHLLYTQCRQELDSFSKRSHHAETVSGVAITSEKKQSFAKAILAVFDEIHTEKVLHAMPELDQATLHYAESTKSRHLRPLIEKCIRSLGASKTESLEDFLRSKLAQPASTLVASSFK